MEKNFSSNAFLKPRYHRTWMITLFIGCLVFCLLYLLDKHQKQTKTYQSMVKLRYDFYSYRTKHKQCPDSQPDFIKKKTLFQQYYQTSVKDGFGHLIVVVCPSMRDPDEIDILSPGPSGSFFINDNFP